MNTIRFIALFMILLSSGSSYSRVLLAAPPQKKFLVFVEKMLSFKGKGNITYSKKIFDRQTSQQEFDRYLDSLGDLSVVVTVDNHILQLFKKYIKKRPNLKGVSVLALNIESQLQGQKNISGIRYEPSVFSLFSSFRFLMSPKAKTLGVAYRSSALRGQIRKARKELKFIGGNLVAVDIDSVKTGSLKEKVAKATSILQSKNVDAIWVPLDSVVLRPDIFRDVWIPFSSQIKKPILVQTEALVSTKLMFATFAVSPSILDLAGQTHQIVEMMVRKNISPLEIGIEESLSVRKVINKEKASDLGLKLSINEEDVVFMRD